MQIVKAVISANLVIFFFKDVFIVAPNLAPAPLNTLNPTSIPQIRTLHSATYRRKAASALKVLTAETNFQK